MGVNTRPRRLLDGLLRASGLLGRRWQSLEVGALVADAERALGRPVGALPPGLSVWLGEAAEAPLSPTGRLVIRATALRLLLRRERLLASPLLGTPLRRPLVITGLHRTGTTTLQRLMALDPAFSHLPMWMMLADVPRRGAWQQRLGGHGIAAFWQLVCPDLQHIHPIGGALPEEEVEPLSAGFSSPSLYYRAPLHGYLDWSLQQDPAESYRLLRRHLLAAQGATDGTRWLLKCPTHLLTFSAFLDGMPDADVVITHRAPGRAVSSFLTLLETQHAVCTDQHHTPDLIERGVALCERSVQAMMAARDRHPSAEARILDLPFRELVADPVAAVRRIYDRFGYPYTPDFEARMRDHLAREARQKASKRAHRLEDYGLRDGEIVERFQGYLARFALA